MLIADNKRIVNMAHVKLIRLDSRLEDGKVRIKLEMTSGDSISYGEPVELEAAEKILTEMLMAYNSGDRVYLYKV